MCVLQLVNKLFGALLLNRLHLLFIRLSGRFQHEFDFSNRNRREVFRKQEEAGKEQTERTQVEAYFRPAWAVIAPGAGQVVAVQRGYNDYEPLKPHPDVYHDRHNKGERNVAAKALDPEELRLSVKKSFGLDWDPQAVGETFARQILFVGIYDG